MEKDQDQQAVWDSVAAERQGAPAETPQPEPQAKVEPEAAPVATEVAKEEPKAPTDAELLRDALARLEKIEGRTRNVEGHIGGLTRNQNAFRETLQAANAAAATTKEAPTTKQLSEAIADPSEWSDLKKQFPEWASATEKFMEAKLSQVRGGGADVQAIEKMVADRVKGETDTVRKEIIDSALDAVFPGWTDEVKTDGFGKWLDSQAADVKALAESSRVGDAARMLRLYDEAKRASPTTQILEQRKQKLAAAAAAPRGVKPVASKSPDDMTPQELWAYEARQRERRKAQA